MAASHTLPHSHAIRKSGVLVLNGYGIRVQVNAGHLLLHDGIADERRTIRLPRVNHGLKRLVMIGSDGFITLEALRWISDVGAAFVMLDRRGKVLAVTGPVSSSDAKLRRSTAQTAVPTAIARTSERAHSLPSPPARLLPGLRDRDKTFPLPRDAAVAVPVTPQCPYPQMQFAESPDGNPLL